MSYQEVLFTRWGTLQAECDVSIGIWLTRPDKINRMPDISDADERATKYIDELTRYITALKEYRADLAARYGKLATMSYTDTLSLKRYRPSGSGERVTYTITQTRLYEDGTSVELVQESYWGAEKKAAFARFEELKKGNPTAAVVVDVEKRSWEK